jgi:hypothetical protein
MEQVNNGGGGQVAPHRVRRSAQEWRALVEAQPSSGLGVEEYCDRHQLSASCFYRWRRCLSGTGGARSPWSKPKRSASPEGFAAVRVVQEHRKSPRPSELGAGSEVIRLTLAGGRELILPASMPLERLVELLTALEDKSSRLEDESRGPERER